MSFPHSPSGSLQVAGVSLEGAYKHVWHPSFCSCHPEDEPLDCLALVNSGACVPRPHRTVANQETVLNQLLPTHPFPPGLSAEGTDRNSHTQSFPKEGLIAYLKSCLLRVRLLI